jgi:hypothetical protein
MELKKFTEAKARNFPYQPSIFPKQRLFHVPLLLADAIFISHTYNHTTLLNPHTSFHHKDAFLPPPNSTIFSPIFGHYNPFDKTRFTNFTSLTELS